MLERIDLCMTYGNAGIEKSKIKTYKTATRKKKPRKLKLDETADFDTTFEGKEDFRVNTFLVSIHRLISELEKMKKIIGRVV